jgi:MFS superfamily sulfate permease-like transporter
MLIWFFGLICGVSLGFVLAGMMAAGKQADEEMERLEQILRREP